MNIVIVIHQGCLQEVLVDNILKGELSIHLVDLDLVPEISTQIIVKKVKDAIQEASHIITQAL